MPVYEFRCKKCGITYDKIAPSNESGSPETMECPDCHSSESVQRIFGKVPVKFKGPGYQKNYLK